MKRAIPLSAEVTLAFGVGAGAFALVAVAVVAADAPVPAIVVGVFGLVAVVAIARRCGIVYASPAAFGTLIAFDWYSFPPTHAHRFPPPADLASLFAYVAVAVLVGELATYAIRSAGVSEAARNELVSEQAALRRVATLVASEPLPDRVFSKVAEEIALLLRVEDTKLYRYETDGSTTVVAHWGDPPTPAEVGARLTPEADSIAGTVFRTARPARIDDCDHDARPAATIARRSGFRSAVGCPIVVDGRLWGATVARSRRPTPLPAETESRMGEFTELLATAISNIEARSQLAASRARIVAAADAERRRLVRDLHDGAQQRLVHTVITLKLARRAFENETGDGQALLTEALEQAGRATEELRELAHGIIPAILASGGLRAGVEALASRTPVPVENGVAVGRLPAVVEATAYFVVAEALTNVAKHARAERAIVTASQAAGMLSVEVRDDGVGGARPDGSGLVGLADRVAALEGRLRVESHAAGGTLIAAVIPLGRR